MTLHPLSDFIHANMEAILQAWEDFARTIEPPALTMDDAELRDHARQMLLTERLIELRAPHNLEGVFDESRIAQVLSNLIGNAVQYSSLDAPVTVTLARTGDDIVVTVNNRGNAIPLDKIACIFDPMVRIAANASNPDSMYTERTSLGIGLYISCEIIRAHGGTVHVTSNASAGTTFNMTLPPMSANLQKNK